MRSGKIFAKPPREARGRTPKEEKTASGVPSKEEGWGRMKAERAKPPRGLTRVERTPSGKLEATEVAACASPASRGSVEGAIEVGGTASGGINPAAAASACCFMRKARRRSSTRELMEAGGPGERRGAAAASEEEEEELLKRRPEGGRCVSQG